MRIHTPPFELLGNFGQAAAGVIWAVLSGVQHASRPLPKENQASRGHNQGASGHSFSFQRPLVKSGNSTLPHPPRIESIDNGLIALQATAS